MQIYICMSKDHLISTMGFSILVRRHFYIESGPWVQPGHCSSAVINDSNNRIRSSRSDICGAWHDVAQKNGWGQYECRTIWYKSRLHWTVDSTCGQWEMATRLPGYNAIEMATKIYYFRPRVVSDPSGAIYGCITYKVAESYLHFSL